MKDADFKISFYTGFPSYATLTACYEFLGPAVNFLVYMMQVRQYRKQVNIFDQNFFFVLVRLRLGLMEQDLADRFEFSQSTTSRIIITWIIFLFLKFKEIPIWPPKFVQYA